MLQMAYTPENQCKTPLPTDVLVTHSFDEGTPDQTEPCVGELYGLALSAVKSLADIDIVAAEFEVDEDSLGALALSGETQDLCGHCASACTIHSLRARIR